MVRFFERRRGPALLCLEGLIETLVWLSLAGRGRSRLVGGPRLVRARELTIEFVEGERGTVRFVYPVTNRAKRVTRRNKPFSDSPVNQLVITSPQVIMALSLEE